MHSGEAHSPATEGPDKAFHIFISYRVKTDSDLAERMCDKLQALALLTEQREMRIKCFLDTQNLTHDQNYQQEFLDGLNASCLFLPIISHGALESMTSIKENGADNVLLEWQTALDLKDAGEIAMIPILVGSVDGNSYKRFESFYLAREIPPVKLGLSTSERNCRETVDEIFKLQGIFMNPAELGDKLKVIVERLSNDVWPKYRGQWADQSALGIETTSTCVQCEKDFRGSENGEGACRFHLRSDVQGYNSNRAWACCQLPVENAGCQRSRHRLKHHNDYPYAAKYPWVHNIVNYVNHSEQFAHLVSDDFSSTSSTDVTIYAGRVLKLVVNDKNKLYIRVITNPRDWFYVFGQDEILSADHNKPILNTTLPTGESVFIRWLVFDNEIRGVSLSCKSRTAADPSSCIVRFEWPEIPDDNGPRATAVEYTETATFGEVPLSPSFKYDLPEGGFGKGPTILAAKPRKRDESLPTWFAPGCPLRAKVKTASAQHSKYNVQDVLTVEVVVMNPSKDNVSVVSAKGFAKLREQPQESIVSVDAPGNSGKLSEKDWVEASKIVALGVPPPNTQPPPQPNFPMNARPGFNAPPPVFRPPPKAEPAELPVMVPAGGTATIEVRVIIKTDAYGGKDVDAPWSRFSLIALRSGCPVIVDIEFEDLSGLTFGCMAEFPIPNLDLASPNPSHLFWLYADDTVAIDRYAIYFEPPSNVPDRAEFIGTESQFRGSLELFQFRAPSRGKTATVADLRRFVSRAQETGVTVLDVTEDFVSDQNGQSRVKIEALIDGPRRSVYALRLHASTPTSESVAFYRVMEYGDALRGDAAIDGTNCDGVKSIGDGFAPLADPVAQGSGRVQELTPVAPRVVFAPPQSSGAAGGGSGGGVSVDIDALVKALRPVITEIVKEVIASETVRIVDAVKAAVSEGGNDIVARVEKVVKEVTDSQSERLDAAMTATATASVALQQNSRNDGGETGTFKWTGLNVFGKK